MKSITLLLCLIFSTISAHASSWMDKTIFAKGQFENVVLDGANGRDGGAGSDGSDGSNGSNASCSSPTDVQAGGNGSNGSDGAQGGRGEDGDSGGDLLVYYTNISDLKNIYFHSVGGAGGRGGPGGRGGRGGYGGYGCNGGSNGYNGSDGVSGSYGYDGSQGRSGILYIKSGLEPILPSQTEVYISLKDFFATTSTLRKNFWETKNNASTLLAPNSVLSDEYFEYQRTAMLTAHGILTSDQKITNEILSQQISLSMNDTGTEPLIRFGDERIIVFFARENQGTDFVYKIDSIYNSDDYFDFHAGMRGTLGKDRRILLSDRRQAWGALPTTIQVRVTDRGRSNLIEIPSSVIQKSPYGPQFLLSSVRELAKYEYVSGVQFTVIMKRNLKGRMLERSFDVSGN